MFKESGPVEWMQFSLLGLSAAVCLRMAGRRNSQARIFPIVAAGILVIAMVRECDSLLKHYLPVLSWKFPIFCLSVGVLLIIFYKRHVFFDELVAHILTPFFSLMWAGFAVVVFGQMIGHGDFLEPVLCSHYTRAFKRILEECFELIGYFLIFVGSIEFWWEAELKQGGFDKHID